MYQLLYHIVGKICNLASFIIVYENPKIKLENKLAYLLPNYLYKYLETKLALKYKIKKRYLEFFHFIQTNMIEFYSVFICSKISKILLSGSKKF
jgi:hypothetical protein